MVEPASRFNALKHGIYAVHQIMFDEKPEDLTELSAEYHEHHSLANPKESLLVDALVHNEWRLRRMRRIEAGLWQSAHDLFIVKNIDTASTCTSGDAFATDSSTFERLQRVVNTCERAYHRTLKDLQVARGHALRTPQPTPQPEHSTSSSANLVSFRQNPIPTPGGAQPPVVHLDAPQCPLCDASATPRLCVEEPRFAPLSIGNKV
jgi:hypothetical protein